MYGGSYRLFTKIFQDFKLKFHFIDLQNIKEVESKINKKTKLIWVETPTTPMMNIVDISSINDLVKSKNILLAVDNTFASPYLQNPLLLGADIVMHSATKYIAGHSAVILGALIVNSDELNDRLSFIQNASGAVPGPVSYTHLTLPTNREV